MCLLSVRIKQAQTNKEAVSLVYQGNVIDLWEKLEEKDIKIEMGSDQTSLHNLFAGGYYPASLTFTESNKMMVDSCQNTKRAVDSICGFPRACMQGSARKRNGMVSLSTSFVL